MSVIVFSKLLQQLVFTFGELDSSKISIRIPRVLEIYVMDIYQGGSGLLGGRKKKKPRGNKGSYWLLDFKDNMLKYVTCKFPVGPWIIQELEASLI